MKLLSWLHSAVMRFSVEDAMTENSCEMFGKVPTKIDNYQHLRHVQSVLLGRKTSDKKYE